MSNEDQPRVLLRPGQAAEMLAADRRTVQRLAMIGEIDGFRTVGGHWRYDQASIEAMIERRRAASSQAS
jgi:excisionase family DNA binding protein